MAQQQQQQQRTGTLPGLSRRNAETWSARLYTASKALHTTSPKTSEAADPACCSSTPPPARKSADSRPPDPPYPRTQTPPAVYSTAYTTHPAALTSHAPSPWPESRSRTHPPGPVCAPRKPAPTRPRSRSPSRSPSRSRPPSHRTTAGRSPSALSSLEGCQRGPCPGLLSRSY